MKTYVYILILAVFTTTLQAQQMVIPSGGELSGTGGLASYSIGQVYYQTVSTDGTSSEGVQQAVEYILISDELVVIEHHSGNLLICQNDDGRWHDITWYHDGVVVEVNNYLYVEEGFNGVYYAMVTDVDGNVFYSKRYYYNTNVTATKSLLIYPVPTEIGEDLNILYSNTTKEDLETVVLKLYDLGGRLIKQDRVHVGEKYVFNTSWLMAGVYTIMIDGETSKIIVE